MSLQLALTARSLHCRGSVRLQGYFPRPDQRLLVTPSRLRRPIDRQPRPRWRFEVSDRVASERPFLNPARISIALAVIGGAMGAIMH
jgi:hypothetical protein